MLTDVLVIICLAMKKRDVEVLFCFEPYDELVLLQLREFDRKHLTSVEKDMRQSSGTDKSSDESGIFFTISISCFYDCYKVLFDRFNWTRQQIV